VQQQRRRSCEIIYSDLLGLRQRQSKICNKLECVNKVIPFEGRRQIVHSPMCLERTIQFWPRYISLSACSSASSLSAHPLSHSLSASSLAVSRANCCSASALARSSSVLARSFSSLARIAFYKTSGSINHNNNKTTELTTLCRARSVHFAHWVSYNLPTAPTSPFTSIFFANIFQRTRDPPSGLLWTWY
jgi:hypothetical protein